MYGYLISAAKKKAKPLKESSVEPYEPDDAKEPPKRNYAPEGEQVDDMKGQNIIHWEGYLGAGYYIRLQTWKKTNGLYVSLRKNQNIGANISAQYLDGMINALTDMREDCPEFLSKLEK
jgi:hypothetical protein